MTSRTRGAALAAALLSTALVLSACSADGTGTDSAGETRTVTADNGSIDVPVHPERVATIGNTTLSFIDLGGTPVGATAESDSVVALLPQDQQDTYASTTLLASSADEVDMEQLASLKPDLILVQIPDSEFELIEKELEAIAPTVFFGLDTEWKELADGIADAVNITDSLGAQKAEFESLLAGIKDEYADIIGTTSFVDVIRWSSSDPGTFAIADIGCSEIARDDVGLNLPEAAEGDDPLAWTALSYEQLGELSAYDVITYPVDVNGDPTEPFLPVVETNTWKALPAVTTGHALGVFCPGNNSYGQVIRYLDSLDTALASLPPKD
jgi:iron complex transport system substrate-binding protein